ncbi:MAG: hypothetical protein U9R08_02885 [Nanoarchaeota archaeon]|nr:hypothetical protein [Nanoarchaeota archaeon]
MALLLGLAGIIFGFTQANASDIREVELKQADYDSNIGWIKEALTEIKEQLK